MLKRWLARPGVQAALAAVLAAWLGFAHRTTRWRLEIDPDTAVLFREGRPLIVAVWHERLPPLVCHWTRLPDLAVRPRQRLHFVISTHRDGRLIARIAQRVGIAVVEGSSSRGGREALGRMLTLLGRGEVAVGITPDGPRGPRRVPQQGVAALAQLSGRPVVCAAAAVRRHIRLGSWDRMMLALPFTSGAVVVGSPLRFARGTDSAAALAAIAAGIDAACARADALAGIAPA